MATAQTQFRVVIVGGGFGGLQAALALNDSGVRVTLIDKRNFHLFQPLLYQVATGGLSPANIAAPIRRVLSKRRNVDVLLGEVTGFDAVSRTVLLNDGVVPYDALIVAAGGVNHYFGNTQWAPHAPGLKTIEDATEIRKRVLLAFERAERETQPALRRAWLTFAIVGAGPTGVELAGALAEIARDTLKHDFRQIDPRDARIVLVEGGPRVLPAFDPKLSAYAQNALEALGVEVRLETKVERIAEEELALARNGQTEVLAARTVLWGAGVKASPLGAALAQATGAQLDRSGRVSVEADWTLRGHPEVFVIGDLAHYAHPGSNGGMPLPGVAPVAMQSGAHAARTILDRVRGRKTPAFAYRDKGSMATIGRRRAVAQFMGFKLTGTLAWLAWLFVHLMYIVEFQNRLLVLMQWAWNYFTFNRAARLITGEEGLPQRAEERVRKADVSLQTADGRAQPADGGR